MNSKLRRSIKSFALLSGLILALFAGISIGVNADPVPSQHDPNGWVCGDTPGECDPNYNVTCCTWGPSGCNTEPCVN